jgi:hypothetical protein
VAWQNVAFEAPDSIYLAAYTLPGNTTSSDLTGSHRAEVGVFQISIIAPIDHGAGEAEALVPELDQLFPNSLRLISGNFAVQIVSPVSAQTAVQDDTHYTLPVRFNYRADTI